MDHANQPAIGQGRFRPGPRRHVIDGEKVAWDELKEMFRTHEGFWFRVTFFSG